MRGPALCGVQPSNTSRIPGTVALIDIDGSAGKSQAGAPGNIILIPKPTSNPDDPLNWTRGRKIVATICWSSYVFFSGIANSNTYSVLVPFSEATGLPIATLNAGTGYLFLLAGWSLFFWQPFALQYGKRLTYLTSIIAQIPLSVWAVHISSSGEWYAKCVLSGFFAAPSEALPELTVADIYFQHERGGYMALYALVLVGSNFFAPIICGFINDGQGWQWVFYWPAVFSAAAFLFMFFFMEETNFDRSTFADHVSESSASPSDPKPTTLVTLSDYRIGLPQSEKTFLQKISLRNATRHFAMVMRIKLQARFLSSPIALYAGFAYGSTLIWFNVLNATASSVLGSPPYNFSPDIVGLTYFAPLIGVVIGFAFAGRFSDWLVVRLAHRNRGVVEPEFRLWIFAASSVITPAALILWGVGSSHGIHWFILMIAMAMLAFVNTCGASLSVNYLVDSYREMSGNALTAVIVVRNTMSFAIGYGITPWIEGMGRQNALISAAFVGLACSLAFYIMVHWGKYFRQRSAEKYWQLVREAQANDMLQ